MTELSTPAAQGTVAFERWAEPSGYRLRLYDGEETGRRYYYLSTERVWLAWCAASPSPEALPASGVEATPIKLAHGKGGWTISPDTLETTADKVNAEGWDCGQWEGIEAVLRVAGFLEMQRALAMLRERIMQHGEWDDGCFYYRGTSASELQEPLRLAAALTSAPAPEDRTPALAEHDTEAVGGKTEAILRRDGHFLTLEWWRHGKKLTARVYEPMRMKVSAAVADLLAHALEQRPEAAPPMTTTNDAPAPAPSGSGVREAANKAEAILRQVRKFIAAENKHARLSEQGKNSTRDDVDFEHAQLVGDFSERDCDEALRIVKRRLASLASDASPRGEIETPAASNPQSACAGEEAGQPAGEAQRAPAGALYAHPAPATVESLPYQVLFNAIAAATDIASGGLAVSISVEKFRAALAPATEGKPDDR